MTRTPKVLILLYLLVGYVVAQFLWWAYSIYDLNAELVEMNRSLEAVSETMLTGSEGELRSKVWMILGEGSVFLTLLLVGAFYIRRFILREHRLARQERNFLLATTHEFNSPIASVKLNLQTLAKRDVVGEQRDRIIEGALSSTQRLELLVTNILMASRIDAGKLELLQESVDLGVLLRRLAGRFATLAEKASSSLVVNAEEEVSIRVDQNAIETAVGNLIENAIKYAPGGKITLSYGMRNRKAFVSVEDQGAGVPKEERSAIFRKFYRSENEDTRSQKGSGLGLYLVKELIELHGGEVRCLEGPQGGALFLIEFNSVKEEI